MNSQRLQKYKALLFDLDGTLAHSMHLHNEAWIECLSSYGYLMTRDLIQFYAGVPTAKTAEIFNERYAWTLDPISVAERKEQLFLKNIHLIEAIPSVAKIVAEYANQKPMAIVSGGTREMVERILSALGMSQQFPIRVCAEDVSHGKPNPDPFLLGAKLLGVDPRQCVVFEDGEAGIQAAMAAGMDIIKVESDFTLKLHP